VIFGCCRVKLALNAFLVIEVHPSAPSELYHWKSLIPRFLVRERKKDLLLKIPDLIDGHLLQAFVKFAHAYAARILLIIIDFSSLS
jgi:hypothetical protein